MLFEKVRNDQYWDYAACCNVEIALTKHWVVLSDLAELDFLMQSVSKCYTYMYVAIRALIFITRNFPSVKDQVYIQYIHVYMQSRGAMLYINWTVNISILNYMQDIWKESSTKFNTITITIIDWNLF